MKLCQMQAKIVLMKKGKILKAVVGDVYFSSLKFLNLEINMHWIETFVLKMCTYILVQVLLALSRYFSKLYI